MRDLTFTCYRNERERQGIRRTYSFDEWCSKHFTRHYQRGSPTDANDKAALDKAKSGAAIILGFVEGTRSKDNVKRVDALSLDLENLTDDDMTDAIHRLEPYTYVYWTTHKSRSAAVGGQLRLRVILPLDVALPAADHREAWELLNAFVGGINDPATKDVSRLHYLPSTFDLANAEHRVNEGRWLSLAELRVVAPSTSTASPVEVPPTKEEEVAPTAILDLANRLSRRLDEQNKSDARVLKAIGRGEPFAEPGQRHNTMLRATLLLDSHFQNATVTNLAALIGASLQAMSASDFDVREEKAQAIRAIEGAREKRQKSLAEKKVSNDEKRRQLIAEARDDGSDHPFNEEELTRIADVQRCTVAELTRRWIAYKHPHAHFLTLDGYSHAVHYSDVPTAAVKLLAPTPAKPYANVTETPILKTSGQLREEYGSLFDEVTYDATAQHSWLDGSVLRLARAKRDLSIVPTFHPAIDEWIRSIGGVRCEKLLDWISVITQLDKQCCAVYIVGPPGIGKSLLANGLASIWRGGTPTPLGEALGRFNIRMAQMPFVLADEHISAGGAQIKSGEIRKLLGDDRFIVEQKGRDTAEFRGALRVMLCANNEGLLDFREDLTRMDIVAIAQRFLFVIPDASAQALLAKQSKDTLGDWKNRHIAEHALWLAENRTVERTGRFLVDGELTESHRKLALGNHKSAIVCEILVRLLLSGDAQARGRLFIEIRNGEIFVNQRAITEASDRQSGSLQQLSPKHIGNALSTLSLDADSVAMTVRSERARYWRLDVDAVADWADRYGYDGRALRRMVDATRGLTGLC